LLLTGTMTRVEGDGSAKKRALQIQLALTDLKTGTVAAQAAAIARDDGLDHTPLALLPRQPGAGEGQGDRRLRANVGDAAGPARRRVLPRAIAEATTIHEATTLYNQERYVEALGRYRSALAMPTGEQLRVVNGIYLASAKLGRTAEAEQAFGRVVALGIAYNELGVKFLFNPGSTEFWSDPKVSGAYPMWLRQIARESTGAEGLHEHRRPHQPDRLGARSTTRSRCSAPTSSASASLPKRSRWRRRRRPPAWDFARTSSAAAPTTPSMRSIAASSSGSFPARRLRPAP
jgi:hypothetical protein